MQGSIALALVAGAVAGAGTSAAAVFLLMPAPGPVPVLPSAPQEDSSSGLATLREENRALSERIDDLEDRLLFAESMRSVPEDVVARETEELDERVKEIVAGMQADDPALAAAMAYPEFEANMRLYEEAKERARDEQRQQAMNERLEERLTELTQKLSLGADQVHTLRTATTGYYSRSAEYFREARETGNFDNARDTLRGFRDEAETAIMAALSPMQQQQYEEADISLLGFGGRDGWRDLGGGGR